LHSDVNAASGNIRKRGYLSAMETYHAKVAELAEIGVDLMHPEGGPPFMVRGHKAEQEIVNAWESEVQSSYIHIRHVSKPRRCARWESRNLSAALTIVIRK
jgi:hypothetical protein